MPYVSHCFPHSHTLTLPPQVGLEGPLTEEEERGEPETVGQQAVWALRKKGFRCEGGVKVCGPRG